MIDMYKELCAGTEFFYFDFTYSFVVSAKKLILVYSLFWNSIEYPIVSIEDPFDKEDWEHVKHFSGLGICQVCLISLQRLGHRSCELLKALKTCVLAMPALECEMFMLESKLIGK